MPTIDQIARIAAVLEEVAALNGISDAFFVGGFPRALAMGRPLSDVSDLDIATGTPNKAVQLAGLFAAQAQAQNMKIHHRSKAVNLVADGVEMDFQGPTSYDKAMPWLHAWGIAATPVSLNLFQRDFTINALAIPLGGDEILDVTRRGMPDIRDQRIASILPPEEAVPEDPIMITRAVRMAARYKYRIDGALWSAMKESVPQLLEKTSPERLAIEAFAMSKYDVGSMLQELGLEELGTAQKVQEGSDLSEAKQ